MSIEVTSLTEISQDTVDSLTAKIVQMIREDNPNLEVRRGPIHSLVLHYMSVLSGVNQENVDRYRRSSSLQEIMKDPELAEDDIVNAVLSNFGVTRQSGAEASGFVTIVVDRLSTVTIPNGFLFTADGVQFAASDSYVARTSADNVQSDTDRVLSPTEDGYYAFDIEVTAVTIGADGLLKRGTALIPSNTIINYIASYAASDFDGGLDEETNAELVGRMQEGVSCKALSNRLNMRGLLRSLPGYESTLHSSIIGFSDAEMLRDRSGLVPVPCGGKVDWYVRPVEEPRQVELLLTATLYKKDTDGRGVWQITIGRDLAPGFYDIYKIQPANDYNYLGSYAITQEIRDVDTTPIDGVLTPHIPSAMHGFFSRYQTSTVRFKDSDTPVSELDLGDTKDYTVVVRAMPGLGDLHDTIGSIQHRNYGGDVLVKAPVPAMVSLGFTINIPTGDPIPDVSAMRQAIADYINNRGFTGKLYASAITDIAHNYVGARTNLSAIDMYAQIFCPDQITRVLRDSSLLEIPYLPDSLVTSKTCVFICNTSDIAVSGEGVSLEEQF